MNTKRFGSIAAEFEQLSGFELIRLIGTGGMARVYLAKDLRLDRDVAVKFIAKQGISQHKLDEAKLMARLNHPNVVQVYDVIALEQHWAIVMEYVQGESLDLIVARKQADITQRMIWALQLVQGLQVVHSAEIVHGDLSTSNVMVDDSGNIKLLDFGIAHSKEINVQGLHINRHFSSPEQLSGQCPDHLSDYFSLGVLLFYLLAQTHPYGEAQERESNILKGQYCVDSEHAKQMPPELLSVIAALLQKRKSKRASSLSELVFSLQQSLNTQQQEVTLPVATPTIKSRLSLSHYIWTVVALITAVIITVTYHQKSSSELFNTHILVSPSAVKLVGESSVESKIELSSRLEHAIDEFVIQQPNLALVSLGTQDSTEPTGFAKQNGINWILVPQAECDLHLCSVQMYLLSNQNKANWATVAKRAWTVNYDQMAAFSLSVTENLPKLFVSMPEVLGDLVSVSAESTAPKQEEFMAHYFDFKYRGIADLKSWERFATQLQQSEQSFSVYWLYRKLAINLYYDSQDLKYINQALQQLRFAPDYYKHSVNYHIDKFELVMASGDHEMASEQLNEIERLGASSNLVAELKARLKFSQGFFEQAVIEYERALDNRNSLNLRHDLALAYFYAGELKKSKANLKQILKLDPKRYLTLQLLGSIYLLSSEIDLSIEMYNRLIQISENSQDLNDLSVAYLLKGELEVSHQYAQKAFGLAKNNPAYLLNLADLNLLLGNETEAKEQYERVVVLSQQESHLINRLILAQAFAHLSQAEQAIALINDAKKQSPNNLEVLYSAALVYAVVGELHSANVHIKEALKLGLGITWFNLPWFQNLCRESWFVNELTNLENNGICYRSSI